ncbi:MAG: site-specific DNA-methyltransferase [Anaerolineae bacterium]|nr:site-specific DNA-methyltransferase [Anaerolineae bacterium]
MTKESTVEIAEAKGRPMLHWVGKRPLEQVTAFPAQPVETYNPTGEENEAQGLLFHGDNKDVLAWLLAHSYRGRVNLIYIDPPFDSGADYVRRVRLRGVRTARLEGEPHSLGEQIQYTDIWANDTYLQFMYERLLLIKELLTTEGSIYLHCDYRRSHHLRCLMDEVFGEGNLVSELVWKRADAHNDAKYFGSVHDTIMFYSKSGTPAFTKQYFPLSVETADTWYKNVEQETGRRYNLADISSPNPRPNLTYEFRGVVPPPFGWRYSRERMQQLYEAGRLVLPESGGGTIKLKRYLDESKGTLMTDWWDDIPMLRGLSSSGERTSYPTQKPEQLVERIVRASSIPGDLLLDCFAGSGTTVAVAQKMGRRWIAADINKGAIQTTSKRLQTIIQEQIAAGQTPTLPGMDDDQNPSPAALSFSVYRVNDYDLQVQHNEAVDLAVEHIGIERTRTDPFFEGTLGRRLVKIVPFNHPLTPLDLEMVRQELDARPEEDRDIVVVCLGKELAVEGWLAEYNRHRPVNQIEVIELRTDQKYGKFFLHQPAQAEVTIERRDAQIVVEIEDFLSPTIVERLEMDLPLFRAQIPDWRAMVDVVLIDASYDGRVFDIALSDVPERKDDLVAGRYELRAPQEPTTVAVKIVDMLGEEVLVTKRV